MASSGRRPFDRVLFPTSAHAGPQDHAAAAMERLREEKSEKRRAAGIASSVRTLVSWTKRVPEKAGPIDFDRFPLHRALYSPELQAVQDMCVMKGTQTGISTWAIRWCMFHVDVRGRTGLYVFPAKETLADYVRLRIDPLLEGPYLETKVGASNNVGFKDLGAGAIAFRGSNAEAGLMSLPVDVLVLDEYDSLVQSNIAEVEQRVTSPTSDGLIRRLGVPHHTEEGIHGEYLQSTQNVWNVKCGECSDWNPMLGPEAWRMNVDQENAVLRCRRCREPIDVRRGEWVAKWPDRSTPGFHIPKLAIHGVDIAGVVKRSKRTRPSDVERWHRNELGWPFTSADSRLSREALLKMMDRDMRMVGGSQTVNLVTMGVDVGGRRPLNVTISEHLSPQVKRKLWVGLVPHDDAGYTAAQHLDDLMIRFGVNFAAIDHMPEYQFAMAFAARWPGQVMRVALGDSAGAASRMDEPIKWDDADASASVDRTLLLDTVVGLFRAGDVILPADVPQHEPDDFLREMGGLVRTTVTDEKDGKTKVKYLPVGGAPFDYLMAEAYDVVATEGWYRAQGLGIVRMRQTPAASVEDAPALDDDGLGFGSALDDDVEYRPGHDDDDGFGGSV